LTKIKVRVEARRIQMRFPTDWIVLMGLMSLSIDAMLPWIDLIPSPISEISSGVYTGGGHRTCYLAAHYAV
jgi:hypothetical protein